MAKARIVGKVASQVVEGTTPQGTIFKKFALSVTRGSAKTAKSSVFGVILYGKLAEVSIQKGHTICVDGRMSIEEFRLDENKALLPTCVISAKRVEVLSGTHAHEAKAYNVLGNLTRDAETIEFQDKNGNNQNKLIKNSIAVNRKVAEERIADFYDLLWFGEKGEKLAQYLKKGKKIMVDGWLQAEYYDKKDGSGKGLNVSIAVDDLEFACGSRNEEEKPQNEVKQAPEIPEVDIDDEEIPF